MFRCARFSAQDAAARLASKPRTLGEGGYGQVQEAMDLGSLRMLAVRCFSGKGGEQLYAYQSEVMANLRLQ